MAYQKNSDTAGWKYLTGSNMTDRGFPGSQSGGTGYSDKSLAAINQRINANKTTTQTPGGTGTKTGGSSNSAADAYNALLAAYRGADYSDYYNQMRAAAQAAYDRGMSALNDAYNSQLSSLRSNLDSTKGQLLNNYNYSKGNIMSDAEQSLKEAYINRMLSEKNLAQKMSAQGLSGGATESTMAGMYNNYGNARNNINTTQNRNLSDLENNYNDNLAQAMQAYNSAVANANLQKAQQAIQLENALANNQISALSDYQSLMQSQNNQYLDLLKTAIANGANFTFDATSANNPLSAFAFTQNATTPNTTNYAALQALMNNAGLGVASGANFGGALQSVNNQNALAQILAQLQAK